MSEYWTIARPEADSLETLFVRAFGHLVEFPELGVATTNGRRRLLLSDTPYALVYRMHKRRELVEIISLIDSRRG